MAIRKKTVKENSPVEKVTDAAEKAVSVARKRSPVINDQMPLRTMEFGEQLASTAKETSSIPIGHLKELTKGRQPRTRMANSREALMRDKEEFIAHHMENITRQTQGRLDFPQEMIPHGFTHLWARASCRDQPDATNLRNLESKGHMYTSADEMPGLAFYDPLHGIRDDEEHIYNGGLVSMIRYAELTDAETRFYLDKSRNQTRALTDGFRSADGDPMFMINQRNQFADPYLENDNIGRQFGQALRD